jgi:tRNA A-37 threonylcarbamoyl transferase component Bud32
MLGWRLGHALIQRGIATARPILVCQPKRGLLPRDSYLATAWIEHAQNLHLYGWALARREPGERERRARHTAESLGRLLGRMHAWNVAHRDLKGCNLVAVEQPNSVDACLIDLDGVRLKRRLSRRERADNLSRLAASVHAHPWVSNTHRLRFLRAYLAVLGKSTGDWKDCWREIAVRSAREIERLQQLGKPVA